MKITYLLAAGIICLTSHSMGISQESKQHISKEFTLSKDANSSTLAIFNVDGFINVEGYSGNVVKFEIDQTLSADDDQKLDIAKKEFKLAFDQSSDTLTAFIAEPYDSRPHRHYEDWRNDREIHYQYRLEFTVKVPFGMNLDISTVNDGNIVVDNVYGKLRINNVNEGIAVHNAKGTTSAHTVNGSVAVNYIAVPPEGSSYSTVNGDIKVNYPASFSGDLEFKSMNGEFYTDFPGVQTLPSEIVKNTSHHGGGTTYTINKKTAVRIGNGGSKFKFETLNGNIIIKKQS